MKIGSRARRATAVLTATLTGAAAATALLGATGSPAVASGSSSHHASKPRCAMGQHGAVKHVVYVQFDNTHLRRDIHGVPSDLQQMPHLLNFMKHNGTLLSNDHTILISHTAGGILSSLTGVYPDRHGQTVSNSYDRYDGNSWNYTSSFGYWTDPVARGVPNMVNAQGDIPPAPWVPFTRAGCDVGAISAANTVLENTGTGPTGDMTKVFGAGSPEWTEATKDSAKAQADFVGFAVHCARRSATCAKGEPDRLPDEPRGYHKFKALYGAKQIDPVLTGKKASVPVTNLLGRPIEDPNGNPGFPGFDGMSAAASLAYSAEMQEAGIPVTFAYISDAHDNHHAADGNEAYGPGAKGYVQQLKRYDMAFARFFTRLRRDGITKHNTLFVFTVDEGDHFVGSKPGNPGCDGVTQPCVWPDGHIGEINGNIDTLMNEQHPQITTGFTVHSDDAPTFYLDGNPGQLAPETRRFERAAATLTAQNPYTGHTDKLMVRMAGQEEMKLLHMFSSGDPARNATFTYFGDADYFLTDYPPDTCKTCIDRSYAWNHGDVQHQIANTWLGFVGPGVRTLGRTGRIWTDHTDVRPTMLTLLGMRDDYRHDGRAILQVLRRSGLRHSLQANHRALVRLGNVYKQLDAPFGRLGQASLEVSTKALASGTSDDDSGYRATRRQLRSWLRARNRIASRIEGALERAEFSGRPVRRSAAQVMTRRARHLIAKVERAAR